MKIAEDLWQEKHFLERVYNLHDALCEFLDESLSAYDGVDPLYLGVREACQSVARAQTALVEALRVVESGEQKAFLANI